MSDLLNLRSIVESIAKFFDVDAAIILRKVVSVALIWLCAWVATRIIKLMATLGANSRFQLGIQAAKRGLV